MQREGSHTRAKVLWFARPGILQQPAGPRLVRPAVRVGASEAVSVAVSRVGDIVEVLVDRGAEGLAGKRGEPPDSVDPGRLHERVVGEGVCHHVGVPLSLEQTTPPGARDLLGELHDGSVEQALENGLRFTELLDQSLCVLERLVVFVRPLLVLGCPGLGVPVVLAAPHLLALLEDFLSPGRDVCVRGRRGACDNGRGLVKPILSIASRYTRLE